MATNRLTINPGRVTWTLGLIAACLIIASVSLQVIKAETDHKYLFGLIGLLDVDGEQNVPAVYSVFLLLTCSGLLAFVGLLAHRDRSGDVFKWGLLCAGFAFMAVDEAWLLHERLIDPVRAMLGGSPENLGVLHFAWVLPAVGLILILGVYFLGFLVRLPLQFRIRFIVAGALYLGGAVGMEFVGGEFAEKYGEEGLFYKLCTTLEESLEMAGLITFIDSLLRYLCINHEQITARFRENPADNTVMNAAPAGPVPRSASDRRAPRPTPSSPVRPIVPTTASSTQTVIRPAPESIPASDQTLLRPPHKRNPPEASNQTILRRP